MDADQEALGYEADDALADIDDAFLESTDPVERQLALARKDLLDMSLRNKLLSFKETRATSIRVLNRDAEGIWDSLYENGATLPFLAAPARKTDESVEDGLDADESVAAQDSLGGSFDAVLDGGSPDGRALLTGLESEALFRRLLRINSAANTLIEEQGVNSLYLALGFIVWYESDSSETERRAPLVLLPVRLARTRRGESFSLEFDGNDVTENLSLREKLRLEFGIELPDFPFDDEGATSARLGDYFTEVATSISMQPRWSVDTLSAYIGFFSFTRFLMYKDLDPKAWPEGESPTLHPVLRKLLSTGGGFANDATSDVDFDSFDESFDVTTSGFVMDADGSQAKAVLEVTAGANLVIQGPPGTGKSQTITNVIGNALSQGKTVLFVAEKLAALNVVKQRLDEAGIGSAALELHSSRATKATVIAEIEATLAQSRVGVSDSSSNQAAELARTKATLNSYEVVVNKPRGPTGSTFVEALGRQLELDAKVGEDFEIEDDTLPDMSAKDFNSALTSFAEADQVIVDLINPSRSVFRNTELESPPVFFEDTVPKLVREVLGAMSNLEMRAMSLAAKLTVEWDGMWATVPRLARTAELIAEKPDISGMDLPGSLWESKSAELVECLKTGLAGAELREQYASQINEQAWSSSDVPIHLQNLRDGQRGWIARLGRRYQVSRRWAQTQYRSAPPKGAGFLAAMAEDVARVQECEEVLRQHDELLRASFGQGLPDSVRGWGQATTACSYLTDFYEAMRSGLLVPGATSCLVIGLDADGLRQDCAQLRIAESDAQTLLVNLWSLLGLANTEQAMEPLTIRQTALIAERVLTELPTLRFAPRLTKANNALRQLGLNRYADLLWDWEPRQFSVLDVFRRAYFRALTSLTFHKNWELLADLDSDAHDRLAAEFRTLDKSSWQEHARDDLARQLKNSLPALTGVGEMRVIAREIAKKRRHLPIRKLLQQAGPALQRIKPVFMMSPLSIAQFLPRGAVHFDLVVFDEASQVRVADALGAIVRGQQVVVVGDTKQMPPTNFFNKMVESDDQDSETADIESVLSMFQLAGAREASLQWHYRSKDPTLISVSNQEFYNRSLILFPSTHSGPNRATGLHLHHDPTALYDRGLTRTNPQEAEAVAAAVIKHARTNPRKSLGVVALSLSQREAIDFAVRRQLRLNPDLEGFFAEGRHESFFVKNLESVQGDERDVIFISIGYGRWAGGKVAHEFGPINRDGGEKRLNVLITRAKERIDVFTNFRGSDLQGSSTASQGVTVLKRFLTYAETGELETFGETGRATDSPFEDEVRSVIEAMNYEVEPQVGEAGYFIDLAVRHPDQPGKYVLAIECDGAAYHSSVWARDRDRLRQEVLEGLGWKFHRVWSTDWYRESTRKREIEKIRDAIEAAIAADSVKQTIGDQQDSPIKFEARSDRASVAEPSSAPDTLPTAEPPRAEPYVMSELAPQSGIQLHEVHNERLVKLAVDVLAVESPVHFDQLVNRLKDAWGVGRAASRSRDHIRRAMQSGHRSSRLVLDGDFLYLDASRAVTVRNRSELATSERNLVYVSPEELDAAIKQVVKDGFSVSEDEICTHVAMHLGFARTTKDMRDVMANRIAELAASSVIEKVGDRYSLPRG